jgi:multiple sugar transport system substrate-binding protein
VAISASCSHIDLALEYVLWVTGKDCQRTLYVESGGQPASKTAWLDAHTNELTNGYFAGTQPVLENAWLRPRFSGFEYFQIKALTIVHQFLKREISCRDTLKQLDDLYRHTLASRETLRKSADT